MSPDEMVLVTLAGLVAIRYTVAPPVLAWLVRRQHARSVRLADTHPDLAAAMASRERVKR